MEPFIGTAAIALGGGIIAYMVRTAPFVAEPFKSLATWVVAGGTVWAVFARLGVFAGHGPVP